MMAGVGSHVVSILSACAMAASLCAAAAFGTPPAGQLTGQKPPELQRARVPQNLLKPLPATGAVPFMTPPKKPLRGADGARQSAAIEGFTQELQALRSKHFGQHGHELRAAGIERLRGYTDADSLAPMWSTMAGEKDDVRLAVLDHMARQGNAGQGVLARIAIHEKASAIRAEATRRIAQPPSQAVLQELDEGLRSNEHIIVNNAGALAGAIHAIEALPALIFAQFAQDNTQSEGDLAWIAIGTQRSYVQNLVPVTGDNSGAFNPVIGQIIEGVVMRVQGCVVTTYRADVHDSLLAMANYDTGRDVASQLGWDMRAWARWFNQEYVPLKQREDQELAKAASEREAAQRAAAAKAAASGVP